MDANEYEAIRGYLLTNVIPPEIKNDRYKKKNFVRKCKGIYLQDNKLMKFCPDLISLSIVLKLSFILFRVSARKTAVSNTWLIPLATEVDTIIGFYHNVTHPGKTLPSTESETNMTGVGFTQALETL